MVGVEGNSRQDSAANYSRDPLLCLGLAGLREGRSFWNSETGRAM